MNTETSITADIIDSVVDTTRGLIYLAERMGDNVSDRQDQIDRSGGDDAAIMGGMTETTNTNMAELWMAARVALVIVGGAMAFIAVMIGIMELASGLV